MTESSSSRGTALPAEEFAAWNERMVERYDIERYYERAHPIVRWVEAARIRELIRLAAALPGDRVVEIGCGAGHVLQHFPAQKRTGVDLSPTMLEWARRRLGPDVMLHQGAAEHVPLPDHAFDVVLCTEVLEHVQDPRRVMTELARIATKGGRIVVSIPNEVVIDRVKRILRRTPIVRRALRTLASEGNEWHLHHMDMAMLRRIIDGVMTIRSARAVPNRLMPVRWVVSLEAQ